MRTVLWFLLILAILVVAGLGFYIYDFYEREDRKKQKTPQQTESEAVDDVAAIDIRAVELVDAYRANSLSADAKFKNRVVEVVGKVHRVSTMRFEGKDLPILEFADRDGMGFFTAIAVFNGVDRQRSWLEDRKPKETVSVRCVVGGWTHTNVIMRTCQGR